MRCWHCGTDLETPQRLAFKATCDSCGAYLHCCRNCKNYKPGMPNDCLIPGTEPITDREKANYCEEFALIEPDSSPKGSPSDAAKKLFGDEDIGENRDFESLFK
jgi:hypothetical protein